MNARAVAAWSLAALALALATTNPVYRALVAIAALNVVVATARPDARPRALLRPLALAALVAVALNLLLSRSGSHHLGPFTAESLVFGVGIAAGLTASVLAVAPLSLSLEPNEVLEALPRPLLRTGTAVSAALNLVPAIGRSYTAIREAQLLRGLRPGLRGLPEVLVPVFLTTLEVSVELAETMEARGFGSGPRTSYARRAWTRSDSLVVAASVLALLLFFAFPTPDWYPFPRLWWPPVNPVQAAACVLLVVPALRWR